MTAERWQQIKAIFLAVLERPAAERPAFLEHLCRQDEALKAEVESFLATYPEGGPGDAGGPARDDALDRGALGLLPAVSDPGIDSGEAVPGLEPGARVGAYRIVREIGRGGMGYVYLAARADDAFTRQVAIKLVRYGVASEDVESRFARERQILADLDHPNIARLLDGGTTGDGVPYFVMDYIEGRPITEYSDAHALTSVERLKLFREVCSAVHHAHRQHVVHRDIKPGNILVTAAGVPKLLDFGIAKIVDPRHHDLSRQGSTTRLMTPDYASPEQVRAEPITVASDIYSLGVLLHELLTGVRPDGIEGHTSRGNLDTSSAGRSGDLDRIVATALREEPERRYPSVEAFSDDIGRYLDGLPVKARRGTAIHRTRAFVRRHPAGAAGAMLGTAALFAGALIFTGAIDARWAAVRGAPGAMPFAKRDWLAIADFDNRTGDSLFDSSLNTALAVTLEQSRYINVFPRRSIEASLRRMKKPEDAPVDARVAEEIAQREGLRLVLAPSIGEVGGKYVLSAALLDPSTGVPLKSESTRASSKAGILDALDALGRAVREDLGEVTTTVAGGSRPLSQVTTTSLDALKFFSTGQALARAARFDDAKALYERALERDPRFVAARAALGMIEFELFDRERGRAITASLEQDLDGLTEREQYNERAFYATIVENDLPKAERTWKAMLAVYPDASNAYNNLGRVYLLMKRYEDAEGSFKEAIRVDPYMIPSYVNLANIYLDQRGDPDAALAVCQRLITYDDRNAWGYGLLGRSLLATGRAVEAAAAFERGLAIRTYVPLLDGLGTTYRVLGRREDALRAFRRALDADGADGSALYEAGVLSQLLSDDLAAQGYFDRFRRANEQRAARDPKNAEPHFNLAATWTRLGDRPRGWVLARRAARLDPSDHFDMARVLSLQERPSEALDELEFAVKAGFRDIVRMRTDADLAVLAGDPRFERLLRQPL